MEDVLSRLRKRDSGVWVPSFENRRSGDIKRTSLYEAVLFNKDQPRKRLIRQANQVAKEIAHDVPPSGAFEENVIDEAVLAAVERNQNVGITVYHLEQVGDSFRATLMREGRGAVHVVNVSGIYLRIRNLEQFGRCFNLPTTPTPTTTTTPTATTTTTTSPRNGSNTGFVFDVV